MVIPLFKRYEKSLCIRAESSVNSEHVLSAFHAKVPNRNSKMNLIKSFSDFFFVIFWKTYLKYPIFGLLILLVLLSASRKFNPMHLDDRILNLSICLVAGLLNEVGVAEDDDTALLRLMFGVTDVASFVCRFSDCSASCFFFGDGDGDEKAGATIASFPVVVFCDNSILF